MKRPRLIRNLVLLVVASHALVGCEAFYGLMGGRFRGESWEMEANLSKRAKDLIIEAINFSEDINPDEIVDHHVHVLVMGKSLGSLCKADHGKVYFHEDLTSWRHPIYNKLRTQVAMSAAGVTDIDAPDADQVYARRLLELVRAFPGRGRFLLYALDGYYEKKEDGTSVKVKGKTDLYIPNDYVVDLATCLNAHLGADRFVPVISVHPYREDWQKELERFAKLKDRFGKQKVRFVKWLPPSMNIDPLKVEDAFYQKMKDLGMVLLSHTGDEHSFRVQRDKQELGNPLRLRKALKNEVDVVMLHSGQKGRSLADLNDDPNNPWAPRDWNFDLFRKMMKEYNRTRKGQGRLFGEIAALTVPESLDRLFAIARDQDLRCRVVNGSDYPIPGFRLFNPTGALVENGWIKAEDKRALDEIYSYNPLLFDFVVKRTMRDPTEPDPLDPEKGRPLPEAMFLSVDAKRLLADKECQKP